MIAADRPESRDFDPRGLLTPLPIGVQIIAAPWREDIALRIAHALEQTGAVAATRPSLAADKRARTRK